MYSSTHSLTPELVGGEWSASRIGHFTPSERAPGTHWIGGWVGPRAILDTVVKRKSPSPRRESNSRTPILQPVTQRYTDWAIKAHKCWESNRNVILSFHHHPSRLTVHNFGWLVFLLRLRDVPVSNLDLEIGYLLGVKVLLGKCWATTLKQVTTASFHLPHSSQFIVPGHSSIPLHKI
jgi:hypothetical protein